MQLFMVPFLELRLFIHPSSRIPVWSFKIKCSSIYKISLTGIIEIIVLVHMRFDSKRIATIVGLRNKACLSGLEVFWIFCFAV